jgi:three-Cys-motif partner protein
MESQPQAVVDDGLVCPEVGPWSEEKYRLIGLYASLFSTGMKRKWDKRVYVDLYAGAGYSRVRDSGRILMGSPLLALSVSDPFDKYVFCDEDPEKLAALKERALRIAPEAKIACLPGNCDSNVEQIIAEIPRGSAGNTVLSLCVVDPFDIGIKFRTISKLSSNYVDFLCLLALYMDANRAYSWYIKENSKKIEEFLGTSTWRDDWAVAQQQRTTFPEFLASKFSDQMGTLRYLSQPMHRMKQIRSYDKNLRLYRLALFSRNERAYEYWEQVLKYSTDQTSFW